MKPETAYFLIDDDATFQWSVESEIWNKFNHLTENHIYKFVKGKAHAWDYLSMNANRYSEDSGRRFIDIVKKVDIENLTIIVESPYEKATFRIVPISRPEHAV